MASRVKNQAASPHKKRTYDPWDLLTKEPNTIHGDIQQAQTAIYDIFINLAKTWQPDDILSLFRQIFIHCVDSSGSNLTPALYTILKAGTEEDFHYTLNRVCYILINNWETSRHQEAILKLIEILETATDLKAGASPQLRTLRQWLTAFLASQAFKDLKIYASRYTHPSHWTHRYTSYLLTSQSLNQDNPDEQRLVSNIAASELKRDFKRNLAMYTIQADKPLKASDTPDNPTLLGEHILPLIKRILAKKGEFNCQNLANIFLAQSQNLKFKQFKCGLSDYLIFSMGSHAITNVLKKHLLTYLEPLYSHYDDHLVDKAIMLRTANQIINFLTIDKQGSPSSIMVLLLDKGYALTLAILLLKVIMISPNSRAYLEAKIGDLVNYYGDRSAEECQWLIQFLEILQVTFTIYSDNNISYNLVPISKKKQHRQTSIRSGMKNPSNKIKKQHSSEAIAVDSYRIFSCRIDESAPQTI